MRLFKFTTTVQPEFKTATPRQFVDWYEGDESHARAVYDEDLHRYGLPLDKIKTEVVECDPETLKPIAQ